MKTIQIHEHGGTDVLKWDDIKFKPVDENQDGGAAAGSVGVGQMGS